MAKKRPTVAERKWMQQVEIARKQPEESFDDDLPPF